MEVVWVSTWRETDVARLFEGMEITIMNTHFTVTLLSLCLQREKIIREQLPFYPIPTTSNIQEISGT